MISSAFVVAVCYDAAEISSTCTVVGRSLADYADYADFQ